MTSLAWLRSDIRFVNKSLLDFEILVASRRNVKKKINKQSSTFCDWTVTLPHIASPPPKFIDHTNMRSWCRFTSRICFLSQVRPESTAWQRRMWSLNCFLWALFIVTATWVTTVFRFKTCLHKHIRLSLQVWGQSSVIWGASTGAHSHPHIPLCCGCFSFQAQNRLTSSNRRTAITVYFRL